MWNLWQTIKRWMQLSLIIKSRGLKYMNATNVIMSNDKKKLNHIFTKGTIDHESP